MPKESKVPTKFYEIADKNSSGFIMDGTGGTQFQQELNAPSVQWIDSRGKRAVQDQDGSVRYQEIRYIAGCDIIDPQEQEKRGFRPNRFEDKIPMTNGFMTVKREGNSIGLYDYLDQVFYNMDATNRPNTAATRFKEVKLDKKAETLLDEDEKITEAKMIVYSLREDTGNPKKKYRYNNDRIDAICRLVGVWDETEERKLILLLQKATTNASEFLEIVLRAEQTVITEISHALDLKVVSFDANVAKFTESKTVIVDLGNDKMKEDIKIEKLSSFLSTEQGNPALTEMRAKLEVAKQKSFNS